jgi:hypothetical protein
MRGRFIFVAFVAGMFASAWCRAAFPAPTPPQEGVDVTTPEAGGEDLHIVTKHGPLHIWRPANYDAHTAGIVIYIHGYLTSVDQTWANDRLALQFHDSGRNALFIAIEAPQSINEEVAWTSLADLLRTVEDRAPYPLPNGPLVVMGHSGAYRTILSWLDDSRVQNVILLDALYTGEEEFRVWLRPVPHGKPHRMVIVANDTHVQANRFARHMYGSARRRSIPAKASYFSPRETQARLLYIRSQYDHYAIVNSGKVIPVLLQISPIKGFAEPKPRPPKKKRVTKPAVPNP